MATGIISCRAGADTTNNGSCGPWSAYFADSPDDDFYSVAMEWDDLELDSKYCEPETVFKDPQQLELTL